MKKSFKQSVAFVLCFVMVLSVFVSVPFTASANDYTINSTTSTDNYYNLVSKKDWNIAPGITESEIILNNDDGTKRQALFVMEADTTNEYVKVINSYSGMVPKYGSYATGVMSKQAAYAEANGYGNVVGAMNTTLSWYTGYSADRVGEPLGFIMLDAETLFDPANCGYEYGKVGFPSVLVINKDFDENGNPRPADIPKVEMPQITSAADLDGWEDQVIPCSSGYIVKDGKNVQTAANHSDAAPRSVVGIKPDGTVVIMLNDGRQSPYSVGMSMYELAEVMLDLGCSFAVNCDGGGSSTYLSQRPGEELKVNNSPSDGAERPTTTGILFISTAPADGELYKAHVSTENVYYTPNSEVQFDAIGTDMAGTEVEIPADATWTLNDSSFGTIDDNGLFVSNGKEGKVTAQLIQNESVVGEASITIVLPDFAFRQDTIVIGYGDTLMLPIDVTTNEGRNTVTYSPEDIVYTLSDDALGTIDGDMFTACDSSTGLTGGTITAVICGQTDKTISAEIRFGKASEIVYDYEDGQLLIDTEPEVAPAEGEPYGWFIRDTRANGHFAYRFFTKKNYTPVGMDIPAQVYLVDRENGMVKNGNYAMGIDIDWTNVTASCHGQVDVFPAESVDLTDATRVGFWMYVPAEIVTDSMQIRAGFLNQNGSSSAVTANLADMMGTNSGVENGGWFYFSWDVLDSYKTFEYFQINSHYTAGEGSYNYYQDITYYIDDLTVDYSDATIDRENPYFTSMTIADEFTSGVEITGQTITTNTINLMAQAYENTTKTNATGLNNNSVKLYVDGVLSDAPISMSAGGTITASGVYLNDGVHTIVMEVSDLQGNVGNIVRKLVVNTEKSAVRLEVPAPKVDLLPTGSIYWLNLVADNLSEIDSVTTTINLDYVNDWELEGMEVAYGFEAEYYINNHNDAVITFTRTETEVADTTILAKLPVRIWMAKGWMDDSGIRAQYISNDPAKQDKYYILTPHAMWYSDGTRDYRLVVSAEAGVVTYLDGSTETFSANETVIQTEMNRYYNNADRQGKWSFHICTPGEAVSKAATCFEDGYENRVFCVGCACGTAENLGVECDNHHGCGSVLEWGTTIKATGHDWQINDEGKLACANDGMLFNGTYTDGKLYVDGVVIGDGWNADKTSYYKDGALLTGSHYLDGVMCTFDDKGVYLPDYKYDGWYDVDETVMYFIGNEYVTGYQKIEGEYYNFDENGLAFHGPVTLCGTICLFRKGVSVTYGGVRMAGLCGEDAEFVLFTDGTLRVDGTGKTIEYATIGNIPWYGKYRGYVTKVVVGKDITVLGNRIFYNLDNLTQVVFEEGSKLNKLSSGVFGQCDKLETIVLPDGLVYIYGEAFRDCISLKNVYIPDSVGGINKTAFKNATQVVLSVAENSYAHKFAVSNNWNIITREAAPEVVKQGLIKDEDGEIRYYVDGEAIYAGLIKVGDYYYYISGNKTAKRNCSYLAYWVEKSGMPEPDLPGGVYEFDNEGRIIIKQGLVKDPDGEIRYYVDGVAIYAGLIKVGDYYYYISGNKTAKRNCTYTAYWVEKSGMPKTDLPDGKYEFDNEGRIILKQGIVRDEDGKIRFYKNGVAIRAGLIKYGDYYYYISGDKTAKTNCSYLAYYVDVPGIPRCDLPEGVYNFDNEGRIILKQGLMEDEDGNLRYYVNDEPIYAGLIKVGDYFYYIAGDKMAKKNCTYFASKTNCELPCGTYDFDENGRVIF